VEIAPLIDRLAEENGQAQVEDTVIFARWKILDGGTLTMQANLGDDPRPRLDDRTIVSRILYTTHPLESGAVDLQPWSVVVAMEPS
jgi:hypothetical protein